MKNSIRRLDVQSEIEYKTERQVQNSAFTEDEWGDVRLVLHLTKKSPKNSQERIKLELEWAAKRSHHRMNSRGHLMKRVLNRTATTPRNWFKTIKRQWARFVLLFSWLVSSAQIQELSWARLDMGEFFLHAESNQVLQEDREGTGGLQVHGHWIVEVEEDWPKKAFQYSKYSLVLLGLSSRVWKRDEHSPESWEEWRTTLPRWE